MSVGFPLLVRRTAILESAGYGVARQDARRSGEEGEGHVLQALSSREGAPIPISFSVSSGGSTHRVVV